MFKKVYLNNEEMEMFTAEIFPKPYNKKRLQEFVSFTFHKETHLKLVSVEKIESVIVRPKSAGIKYEFDEHNICLTIKKPANFSVEINGKIVDNLLVFVRPEREYDFDYENVIRFEKGQHTIDK